MRVLFADDDHDLADMSRRRLELAGHEVCIALDGVQAVELAISYRPEVVMLDINMPKLTGFEAALQIRALLPKVRLVAVSGWPIRGRERELKTAGFDQAAVKPVDVTELCSTPTSGALPRSDRFVRSSNRSEPAAPEHGVSPFGGCKRAGQ